MFLMLIVQRVEDRDGDFGIAHVAGGGSLLPETIARAHVQEVVAADAVGWDDHPGGRDIGEERECLRDWVGGRADMVVSDFSAQAAVPFGTEPRVDLGTRRTPPHRPR